MKKSILSLLLACVFALSCFLPLSTAAGGVLKLSGAEAYPGETVTIDLTLSDNPGFVNMMLTVRYDPALTLTGVTDKGVIPGQMHAQNYSANPYQLTWMNDTSSANITANGVIASLSFRIADDAATGIYPVTVSYNYNNLEILDVNMQPVIIAVESSGITVKAAPCRHPNAYAVAAVPATCLNGGLTEGKYCPDCGEWLKAQTETAALGHDWGAWTAQDDVNHSRACGRDASHTETAPHTWDNGVVSGTKKTYTCTVCGKTKSETVTPPAPQGKVKLALSGASAAAGERVELSVSLRENPGFVSMQLPVRYDANALTLTEVRDTGLLPGAMHTKNLTGNPYLLTWENDTAAADIKATGAIATLVFTVKPDAKPGSYTVSVGEGAEILNVYMQTIGVESVKSTVAVTEPQTQCAHKNARTVQGTAATCTAAGLTAGFFCPDCGVWLTPQETVPALGHDWGKWLLTRGATETEEGVRERDCKRCGIGQAAHVPVDSFSFAAGPAINAVLSRTTEDSIFLTFYVRNAEGLTNADTIIFYDPGVMTLVPSDDPMTGGYPDERFSADNGADVIAANTEEKDRIALSFFFLDALPDDSRVDLITYEFRLRDPEATQGDDPVVPTVGIYTAEYGGFGKLKDEPMLEGCEFSMFIKEDFSTLLSIIDPDTRMPGDVDLDGRITAADARLSLRRAVQLNDHLTMEMLLNANVDGKFGVSAADARLILRCAVGLETPESLRNRNAAAAPAANDKARFSRA